MAQKVHITLEDDIDGSEAVETVRFGLDGTQYEIDLNGKHADALRKAMTKYVEHGRKVKRHQFGKNAGPTSVNGHSAREIRDWARSNGHKVPDRGRIPKEVQEAFAATG